MLALLRNILGLEVLSKVIEIFPSSLYMARKIIGLNRDAFTKYIVYTRCEAFYSYQEAIGKTLAGKPCSNKCNAVLFPNHTYESRRKYWGTL